MDPRLGLRAFGFATQGSWSSSCCSSSAQVEAEHLSVPYGSGSGSSSCSSSSAQVEAEHLSVPYGSGSDDDNEDNSHSFRASGNDDDEESQLSSVTFEPPRIINVGAPSPSGGLSILSHINILEVGLVYAGFDKERQAKNNTSRKIEWFKAFYGVAPTTIVPFFLDIKAEFPDISYKHCLMTMNWLYLYDTYPVLSGRWKYCEEYIGGKLMEYGKMMAIIAKRKIVFTLNKDVSIGRTVDCSTFMIYEMRLDPSSKWFDWKTHSCGLKYEFSLAIYEARVTSVRGPDYPSTHDITVFRGGTSDEPIAERDQSALYFQIEEGEKFVADSGYAGEPEKIVMTQDQHPQDLKEFLARCKNRQETFHWRLKAFNILGGRFRHGKNVEHRMELHRMAVDIVVGVIQYDYENGHPPFDVC